MSEHITDKTTTRSPAVVVGLRRAWPVVLATAVIAAGAQIIGALEIPAGPAKIVIYPMVWGLLIAGVVSFQSLKPVGLTFQKVSSALVGTAVLLLVARLAFNIGPNLPLLLEAGPALLLQELGHLLGTVALALPLAVLLRMGKATIGATFSIDREPSFAMVSEKYGPDSDQYRGVLTMYVFGTLFGAVYITVLTSLAISTGWFSPLAMAMGAGVGSGSMLAASVATIVGAYPDQESAILGLSAISNLITTVFGVYFGIWVALPLADKFYRFLTRRQAAAPAAPVSVEAEEENRQFREKVAEASAPVALRSWVSLPVMGIIGILIASIAAEGFDISIVAGYLILIALLLLGTFLGKVTRKISPIVWVTTIGALLSSPLVPFGAQLADLVATVDFLSIGTVALVCAGLSIGKELPLLRSVGWKIIPVGLVAISASFLLSTIIAEFTLGIW